MNRDKLIKRNIISNFVAILILIINFIICFININNLIDSNDSFVKLIGAFGSMMLPYMIIGIVIQFVSLILLLINRGKKQILNIINLSIEIIYFIFTNFAVVPCILLNLLSLNNSFMYLVFKIFELINIYILILMIKIIIVSKKIKVLGVKDD